MSTSTPERDPITTHVLDSTTGLPAPSIPVRLEFLGPPKEFGKLYQEVYFIAMTSADGRIMNWTPRDPDRISLPQFWRHVQDILSAQRRDERMSLKWSLKFDTLAYWGEGKTFYPEVEVKFFTMGKGEERDHYHVPILLGPWGYTTYRGS